MKRFLYIILLQTVSLLYAQNKAAYFHAEDYEGYHLYFHPEGDFTEFMGSYVDSLTIRCNFGMTISYGQYKRICNGYRLTSSQEIQERRDTLPYMLSSNSTLHDDSLCIYLNSPYEDLLLYEKRIDLCAYKHKRIYHYSFQITCDESSNSQVFELEFNQRYRNLDTNYILCQKPKGTQIKSLFIKVFWKDADHAPYKTKDTVYVDIPSLEPNLNRLDIRLDTFDYFYLSSEKYNQALFRFKGRNKAIFNGKVFRRERDRKHPTYREVMKRYGLWTSLSLYDL